MKRRQQVYGGPEADERRSAKATTNERYADNAVADREHGPRMQDAWNLGTDYGRRVVANVFEEKVQEARDWLATQPKMTKKAKAKFLAAAQKDAYREMSSHTFGTTDGKRGPWEDAA